MESSHLVIFSTSGKFITKFSVLRCIASGETLFWTGARGQIPVTLNLVSRRKTFEVSYHERRKILVYPANSEEEDVDLSVPTEVPYELNSIGHETSSFCALFYS